MSVILIMGLAVGVAVYYGVRSVYMDLLAEHLVRVAGVAGTLARDAGDPILLERFAEQVAELTEARVTIISRDGSVLEDTEADPALMDNHASRPEVRKALLGGTGTAVRKSGTVGREMLYIAAPAVDGLVVRLAVPLDTVRPAISRLRLIGIIPLLIGCLGGLILLGHSARRATAPLAEMAASAREMASGRLDARSPVDGPLEVAGLGASLNLLVTNLESHIRQLDAAKSRLEILLADLPSGVIEIDQDYRIVSANAAAERLLSFRVPEVRGRHYSVLITSYALADAVGLALQRGESSKLEVEPGRGADDLVHVSVSPLRDASGTKTGAVLVLGDLGQTRRDARLRRELVANVSHELKTPVAAIRALAEALSEGALSDRATAARFLAHIERESERLARLVNDLLALARLEARQTSLEKAPVDMMALISRAAERMGPLAEARKQRLTLEALRAGDGPGGTGMGGALPALTVFGDERYLERAVLALLDNAIKYTPDGGSITVGVRPVAREDAPCAEVSVTDTGPGLSQEAAKRVFERFYRVDSDRSRQAGGTGLGLAIVKHIAQAHGGEAGVASDGPGLGCRFWFRVPLCGPPAA
ncbi:MAG: PAS domain-containing protein [Bacillota bacterium]|nr:MAG: PAS domain-containing protein [Bacillota bacterium]